MKKTYVTLALLGMLIACDNKNTGGEVKKADTTKKEVKTTQDTTDLSSDIQKVAAELPSPVDFISHINQAKLDYAPEYLNSTDNVANYLGASAKTALNLGIYMVDMGYNSLYIKSEVALRYLKIVKKLSDQLNILDQQTKFLVSRFEGNLENRDSLLTIARDGYFSIDEYLRKNDKKDISTYILVGSWTEGLYIGASILKKVANVATNEKYKLMLWRVGGQKNSLNNLIGLIEKLEKNDYNKQLLAKLQDIRTAYADVKVEEGSANDTDVFDIAEVQNSDEITDKMMNKSIKKVEISQPTLDKIYLKLTDLRQFITSK